MSEQTRPFHTGSFSVNDENRAEVGDMLQLQHDGKAVSMLCFHLPWAIPVGEKQWVHLPVRVTLSADGLFVEWEEILS